MHLENNGKTPNNIKNKDLNAVIRIGTDFISNYYEIRTPLYVTPISANTLDPNSAAYNDTLWPAINNLNVDLSVLPNLKLQRNINGSPTSLYSSLQPNGQTYSIMGEPNLGEIRGVLIGVQNENNPNACGQVYEVVLVGCPGRYADEDEPCGGEGAKEAAGAGTVDRPEDHGEAQVQRGGLIKGFVEAEQRVEKLAGPAAQGRFLVNATQREEEEAEDREALDGEEAATVSIEFFAAVHKE